MGPPAGSVRPWLSVVIPAYEHERYVGEAVDSVRAQTLPAGELVVVDDGSRDGTARVVAERAGPDLNLVRQPNRGAHAAINRAIELTSGEYVAILNSDDVFEPERLEHAWAVARVTGAALLFGTVRLIDADGAALPSDHATAAWYAEARRTVAESGSLRRALGRHNVAVTTSNCFVHRELWRRLGGFRPYRYVHDLDFLLRALELCPDRVSYAPELCDVRYRVHADNTIANDPQRALDERDRLLRELGAAARRARVTLGRFGPARAVRRAVGAATLAPLTAQGASVDRGAASGSRRKPLSVGVVTRSLGVGGLEEVVALLAQALPPEDVAVSVLCTHGGGPVADRLRASGVPVSLGDGRPGTWRAWMESASCDVLSTHFVAPELVELAAEVGVPAVETIHNTYAWLTGDDWADEATKAARLAGTIAVSETAARYYRRHCPSAAPPVVVPNAVHPARAARAPRAFARRRLGLADDQVAFVHLGRITRQKNLSGLLAAFAEVRAVRRAARLLLVGPEDRDGSLPALRRSHGALFRSGAVLHRPSVEAVGAVLSAADAYVSNSFYEGWSVAASEALWVGLPVVLSDCGGAAELVGADGARGVLVPNAVGDPLEVSPALLESPPPGPAADNVAALTRALLGVVDSRASWAGRAGEIRACARSALAPQRMASAYAEVLREAAGRG